MGTRAEVDPQEGTTSNKYTILGRLAGGGMADIYLARATNEAGADRYVVLKRVLAERSRDPVFARMFLDEARLASLLHNPNIAQVHDIGSLAGSYFFTMEFVHGEDVRHIMQKLSRQKKSLPISHALHVASGALAALHHAHERTTSAGKHLGIVHRDVSPSNVMVAFEGVVKLLDFGVAKASERAVETRSGVIKGKISYLSPEQCHGKSVDRRSDIFSLGIVLHEMLVGRRLYKRNADFETMMAIVGEATQAPSAFRKDISPALDAVVMKALAKEPADRYATAAEMLEAIETVATTERHAMSATAMGKFLRELFGDRQEPWVALEKEPEPSVITITGESFRPGDGPLQLGDLKPQRALQEQLDRAPALSRPANPSESDEGAVLDPIENFVSGPISTDGATPRTTPPSTPIPRPTFTPVAGVQVSVAPVQPPARPWTSTANPMQTVLLPDPPEIEKRRGWIALATIGGVAMIALLVRCLSSESPKNEVVAQVEVDAAIAIDAAPAAVEIDAPVVEQTVERPTIKSVFAKNDFEAARTLCNTTNPKTATADERVACVLAACRLKDKSLAMTYYATVAKANQSAVEQACKDKGISLRKAPGTPSNPCATNPLKCRK